MTPEKRVRAYIEDFYEAWLGREDGPSFPLPDFSNPAGFEIPPSFDRDMEEGFGSWEKTLREVNARHMTETGPLDHGTEVISGDPDYNPSSSEFVAVEVGAEEAAVEVKTGWRNVVFRLVRKEEDWRIWKIRTYQGEAGADQFHPDRVDELLEQLSAGKAPTRALPAGDDPNCDLLFREGTLVGEGRHRFRVDQIERRSLHLSTGAVGVYDISWDNDAFAPRDRRVEPGTYPVEIASGSGGILALRVLFQEDSEVLFYRPACALGQEHSSVGIDSGMVAVFDAEAYLRAEKRQVEDVEYRGCGVPAERTEEDIEELRKHVESKGLGPADQEQMLTILLSMPHTVQHKDLSFSGAGGPVDVVMCQAGLGDGRYPVYWGLDEMGEVVSLVVDFLVGAEWMREKIEIELREAEAAAAHPLLEEYGIVLRLGAFDGTPGLLQLGLKEGEGQVGEIGEARDASGRKLGTEPCMTGCSDSWTTHYWDVPAAEVSWPVSVKLEIITGYRNGPGDLGL